MRKKATTHASDPKKAVAYARVSTPEQAERDLSLPAQLKALRKYADDHDLKLAGEYVEPGVSATDDNRPEFQRMLQEVLRPNSGIGTIIVTHTSRFMRNATKARLHKETLRRRGVRVIAVQQRVTDDPNGRFTEGMFELIDQLESETNGIRTRAGMAENAKQGFFNGSAAPYGFKVEKVMSPSGSKNKLVVDRQEAELLQEVFTQYVSGRGAKAVARYLNQSGLLYRKLLWSRDLVLRVISERAAVGTYYWGRRDSRTGQPRPESEWIAMSVEPVLDEELFNLAQEMRAKRDPVKNPGRLSSSPLLLSRLLRCGRCGDTCQLETSGKCDSQGRQYRYYNCRRFCRSGKEACEGHRIAVDVLDRAVLNYVAHRLFTADRCREIIREFVEEQGVLRQRTVEQRRLLERERDELDKRLSRWYERIETEPELGEIGAERMRELKTKRQEVVGLLAKLKQLHSVPPYVFKSQTIQEVIMEVQNELMSGNHASARVYLEKYIDRITVDQDDIVIEVRPDAALSMMKSNVCESTEAGLTGPSEVLADVVCWRARRDSNP